MSEWRPIKDAPIAETVIVWGGVPGGGLRFMRQDAHGQWRNMMGRPRDTPTHWMPPPEPPESGDE